MGDDTLPATRGTFASPFKTIQAAVTHADDLDTISLNSQCGSAGGGSEAASISGGKSLLFAGAGLASTSGSQISFQNGTGSNSLQVNFGFPAVSGVVTLGAASSGVTVRASGGEFLITLNSSSLSGPATIFDSFLNVFATLNSGESETITLPSPLGDSYVVTRGGTLTAVAGGTPPGLADNDGSTSPQIQIATLPSNTASFTPAILGFSDGAFTYGHLPLTDPDSTIPTDTFQYFSFSHSSGPSTGFIRDDGATALAVVLVGSVNPPAVNPPLPQACGLDIMLVMDSSGSIGGAEDPDGVPIIPDVNSATPTQFEQQLKALIDLTNAFLPDTPTLIGLVEFNSTAGPRLGLSGDATTVTDEINGPKEVTTQVPVFGDNFTNYDDAFRVAFESLRDDPNNRLDRPDMIVFSSDGVPTVFNHPDSVDPIQSGEGTTTPVDAQWLIELEAGVEHANDAKNAGIHIEAFGIELSESFGEASFALEQIAGPGAVTTSSFDTFSQDLRDLAITLCGGTITVNKLFDADGDLLGTPGDQTPADETNPVTFVATTDLGQFVASQLATGSDGAAVFDIDGLTGTASVSITEQGQPLTASCTVDGQPTGSFSGSAVTEIQVGPLDIVSCTFINGPPAVETLTLTVRKDFDQQNALGAPATSSVTIELDGSPFTVTDTDMASGIEGQTPAEADFPDGTTVTVTEAGLGGVDLANYDVSLVCNGLAVGTSPGLAGIVSAQVPVSDGNVDCTFTNERRVVDLFISKLVDDNSVWDISVNGVHVSSFANGTGVAVFVPPNVELTITETGVAPAEDDDYSTSVICEEDHDVVSNAKTIVVPGLNPDPPGASDGFDEVCTFTNTLIPAPVPPDLGKEFSPDEISAGGTSTLTFTIDNNSINSVDLTDLAFTDNLPANVAIAASPAESTDCGGVVTAPPGGGAISFSGGSLLSEVNCTITVDVTSSVAGPHVNTTGNLTSSLGTHNTATDILTVTAVGTGKITIQKVAVVGDNGVAEGVLDLSGFGFDVDLLADNYDVADITTDATGMAMTQQLTAGGSVYGVTELVIPVIGASWTDLGGVIGTSSADCFNSLPDTLATSVDVTLNDDDDVVVCWYNALETANITIEKVVDDQTGGGAPTTGFVFELSCTLLGSTPVPESLPIDVGNEAIVTISIGSVCTLIETDAQGADEVSGQRGDSDPIVVTTDETITITNTFFGPNQGTITLVKDFDDATVLPADDTATATLIVDNQQLLVTGNGSLGPLSFDVGDLVHVDEVIGDPSQWAKTGFGCVRDSDGSVVTAVPGGGNGVGYDIVIEADELIICTFTNTRRSAELVIKKVVVNDSDPASTWGFALESQQVASLGDGATSDVIIVPLGTHSLVENSATSASTAVSCDNGDAAGESSVEVTFDTDGERVTCTFTNTLEDQIGPRIDIRKQAEGSDSRTVEIGSDVTFEIVVTNVGDVKLTGVTVTDPLVPDCERTIHGDGHLQAGESETYTCTAFNVTSTFTNVATATGTEQGTTNEVSDSDPSTVVVLAQEPMIDIQKTPDSQTIAVGGTANFTITVTNTGDVPLINVEVSDALAPDCGNSIGSLAAGAVDSYNCSLAGVSASFTNVAVVFGEVPDTEGDSVSDQDSAFVQVGSVPPQSPPPITITIVKDVTTSGIGFAPEAGTEFGFELDCIGPDFSFSLADGQSFQATISPNTLCTLTETDSQGATGVSGEFSSQLLTASQTFTVTNNYHLDEPEVLGTAITKTLTSADPAAVDEDVLFDIAVTFQGDVMPNAELVDSYDPRFIEFLSASVGGANLDCDSFPAGAALSLVVCDLGDATGPFTVTMRFTAVAPTVPGLTINTAEVSFDVDGDGPQQRQVVGPVNDDVEIVQVLALAPLGDGPAGTASAGGLAALLGAAVAAALGARLVARRARGRDEERRAA